MKKRRKSVKKRCKSVKKRRKSAKKRRKSDLQNIFARMIDDLELVPLTLEIPLWEPSSWITIDDGFADIVLA